MSLDLVERLEKRVQKLENIAIGDPGLNPDYCLLKEALHEIKLLRKENSDMRWEISPDRMGK